MRGGRITNRGMCGVAAKVSGRPRQKRTISLGGVVQCVSNWARNLLHNNMNIFQTWSLTTFSRSHIGCFVLHW